MMLVTPARDSLEGVGCLVTQIGLAEVKVEAEPVMCTSGQG